MSNDKRLAPNERKHPLLWQYYLLNEELVKFKNRHINRNESILRGKSNLSSLVEKEIMEAFNLDAHTHPKNKKEKAFSFFSRMVEEGEKVGPIWDWMLAHKGIAESLAAKVLSLIDDIGKFDSVSKLWRYSGYGIYEYWCDGKGKMIAPKQGWKWQELKVKGKKDKQKYRVWTVIDHGSDETQSSNVNNHTAHETHNRDGIDHPNDVTHLINVPEECRFAIPQNSDLELIELVNFKEPKEGWALKKLADRNCESYHSPFNRRLKSTMFLVSDQFVKQRTPGYRELYDEEKIRLRNLHPELIKVNGTKKYTDGHIHNMAMRKIKKEFLKQLWLKWREYEGLDISEEY